MASLAAGPLSAQSNPAATIFVGHFITLDSVNPVAEAIAVRDGRIVAIGSRRSIDSSAGRGSYRTVLPGAVLPGFTDAHVHAPALGDYLASIPLGGASKATILARVKAASTRLRPGQWIVGAGWDQSFWDPPDFPTAKELDRVSGGHPVMLDRIDGHAIWVNSAALARADVTVGPANPPGGEIIRDPNGRALGVFIDDAMDLIRRVVPRPSMAERVRRRQSALAQYAKWGVTSIHDAGLELPDIESYRILGQRGPLPVRVYAMAAAADSTLDAVLRQGPVIDQYDGTFTLRTVKIVDDGALGSRGARLGTPYQDDPSRQGFDLVPHGRLDSLIARSLTRGFQVAVHAIGDASVHDVLDAFERAGVTGRRSRFRLEHASMIQDTDLPRLGELGVIASMQPVFVGEYSRFAQARLGMDRLRWVYRTREVSESGAVLAAGTDFPASDTGDPIATLASMVTRQGYDGQPVNGWFPEQKVSVDVALRSMTVGAAFAAFQEGDRGTLRVGQRADLTVLSGNPYTTPPDQLRSLVVLETIVGGKITYRRPIRK